MNEKDMSQCEIMLTGENIRIRNFSSPSVPLSTTNAT